MIEEKRQAQEAADDPSCRKSIKIGFEEMAQTVAKRWRTLQGEELAYYKDRAKEDLERYRREMDEYQRELVQKHRVERGTTYHQGLTRSPVPVPTIDESTNGLPGSRNQQENHVASIQSTGDWSAAGQQSSGGSDHTHSCLAVPLYQFLDLSATHHIAMSLPQGSVMVNHHFSNRSVPSVGALSPGRLWMSGLTSSFGAAGGHSQTSQGGSYSAHSMNAELPKDDSSLQIFASQQQLWLRSDSSGHTQHGSGGSGQGSIHQGQNSSFSYWNDKPDGAV